ncbi:hypothetical protein CMQ_4600 [Grosmannia clavigera kw1407]|uniref:Uncharacterized protein n=1 Tax=Grosmannia clavigera (strain kw1407 / UAMH 11150) TaxID=655863 RepID=F0XUX6_GROCL|nr:uncharacterized protein CMQ_4600 [Grosmannia clavigera kw1407]EFW98748.1 hypothetical protein CMQ_4600 [Grosmannia clavigera kw1407]
MHHQPLVHREAGRRDGAKSQLSRDGVKWATPRRTTRHRKELCLPCSLDLENEFWGVCTCTWTLLATCAGTHCRTISGPERPRDVFLPLPANVRLERQETDESAKVDEIPTEK